MNFFIGLSDYDWYSGLRDQNYDKVNFGHPCATDFAALQQSDMFLFQLKKPYYAVIGGGFFISYSSVPLDLAWQAFGQKPVQRHMKNFLNVS